MQVNGTYVGIGLGDDSATVADIFAKWSDKFKWVKDLRLAGTKFTERHQAAVAVMQQNYIDAGKLTPAEAPIRGVINVRLKEVSGYLKPKPKILRIAFTVEGHMSNMFFGPCAQTASALEQQGVVHWKPVGDWDTTGIPFKNSTGVEALFRQLSRDEIEGPVVDGRQIMWPFPPGTPWDLIGFSQGGMICCEFMWKYVLPPNAPLHYRLKDFHRGLMFGNPRRAKDAIVPWALSPPSPGTHGIMDRLFDARAEGIGDRWAENANDQDMFAEVSDDEMSQNQTAVAKIITEGKFTGGPTAILSRVMKIFGNPLGGLFGIAKATVDAVMFLAANPNPHYSTFAGPGDIEWVRG
jgi:hypothetical protein